MKRFLSILCAILMLCVLTACNDDSTDESSQNALYTVPDFSVRPEPSGDTAIVTIDELIERIAKSSDTKFSFASDLDNSTQTVYASPDFKDGTTLESSMQPLTLIEDFLTYTAWSDFRELNIDDFESNDAATMYYMKEDVRPDYFQDTVVTDVCLDLTDASLLIRSMTVFNEDTGSSTFYSTITIRCEEGEKYNVEYHGAEYGDDNGTEFVVITNESMKFTSNNGELANAVYHCTNESAVISDVVLEESGGMYMETQSAAEKLEISAHVSIQDGKYNVTREMIASSTEDSHNVANAKEIYRAEQTIAWDANGYYVLTEKASGLDENSNHIEETQYVTFTSKE